MKHEAWNSNRLGGCFFVWGSLVCWHDPAMTARSEHKKARKTLSPRKRVIISVSDPAGIYEFAQVFADLDFEIIATSGTGRLLRQAGFAVIDVSAVTGFPEIFGGRVKTFPPPITGAILMRPDNPEDQREATSVNPVIEPVQFVVCNLYLFAEAAARAGATKAQVIEKIDVGGPTMIRAAAKNYAYVGVVTSPDDYDDVAEELRASGGTLSPETRWALASKAFRLTAGYDTAIANWFDRN